MYRAFDNNRISSRTTAKRQKTAITITAMIEESFNRHCHDMPYTSMDTNTLKTGSGHPTTGSLSSSSAGGGCHLGSCETQRLGIGWKLLAVAHFWYGGRSMTSMRSRLQIENEIEGCFIQNTKLKWCIGTVLFHHTSSGPLPQLSYLAPNCFRSSIRTTGCRSRS